MGGQHGCLGRGGGPWEHASFTCCNYKRGAWAASTPCRYYILYCILYIIYLKILKPLYRCTYFYVYLRKNSYTQLFGKEAYIYVFCVFILPSDFNLKSGFLRKRILTNKCLYILPSIFLKFLGFYFTYFSRFFFTYKFDGNLKYMHFRKVFRFLFYLIFGFFFT